MTDFLPRDTYYLVVPNNRRKPRLMSRLPSFRSLKPGERVYSIIVVTPSSSKRYHTAPSEVIHIHLPAENEAEVEPTAGDVTPVAPAETDEPMPLVAC